MPSKSTESMSRSFNPIPVAGLSDKARQAVNAALDAMSTWRNETAEAAEANGKKVLDKMAAAAAAMGWPEQVVDVVRGQIQTAAEIQIKTMDQILDAWEAQMKLPNPAAASTSEMLSRLQSLPGFGQAGSWPGGGSSQPPNPLQVWAQFVEQWQKSWADTMASLAKGGKPST